MKTLSPTERVSSGGSTRWWTALVAVVSIGCLPLFSVLADQNDKNTKKGGDNKAPSSHQGDTHTGSVNKAPNVHPEGNHMVNTPHPVSSHTVSTQHSGENHTASPSKAVNVHQNRNNGGVNKTVVSHQGNASHNVTSKTVTSHKTATRSSVATKNEHTRVSNSEVGNVSRNLKQGGSSNTRTSLYEKNKTASGQAHNNQQAVTKQQQTVRTNQQARINAAARATTFNHSLTVSSAQGLMSRRLTQISNRQWTDHGTVFSTRSDPQRGFWFQRGGFWWRCNFWGAHAFCDHLIVTGWPAGLCWAWYDDICWGNIVIGMPLELVTYYYPGAVYTSDTTYDGEDATVYYYATDDGRYKQVTVVDGDVVDVEIVDHIS